MSRVTEATAHILNSDELIVRQVDKVHVDRLCASFGSRIPTWSVYTIRKSNVSLSPLTQPRPDGRQYDIFTEHATI
jgi:hypothetical protein